LRHHLEEIFAALRGSVFWFSVLGLPFIVLGVIALGRIDKDGPNGAFLVGNTPVPKFLGAGTSNLDVVIFCGVAVLAVAVGLVIRYFQHIEKLRFLRGRGVRDFDRDGKVDAYTDKFLDDL
jgi:hypothetical protein